MFEKLAHVALGGGAEFVGGNDVEDVGGEALFVDRERGAVHLARGGDDEMVEFDGGAVGTGPRSAGGEGHIKQRSLARGDDDRGGVRGEAGEGGANPDRARRDRGETVAPVGIGEGFERGALNRETGFFEGVARRGVGDAALDRAGGDGLGAGRRDDATAGQRASAGENEDGGEGGREARAEGVTKHSGSVDVDAGVGPRRRRCGGAAAGLAIFWRAKLRIGRGAGAQRTSTGCRAQRSARPHGNVQCPCEGESSLSAPGLTAG